MLNMSLSCMCRRSNWKMVRKSEATSSVNVRFVLMQVFERSAGCLLWEFFGSSDRTKLKELPSDHIDDFLNSETYFSAVSWVTYCKFLNLTDTGCLFGVKEVTNLGMFKCCQVVLAIIPQCLRKSGSSALESEVLF
ncbi:hypothetical protein DAPPUDRAFT_304114 [Daphnia pulex]|uniref:Uncharacterized protein n=1 Tax=Daphnia pulex TaxID=6669 RepID=E9GJA8_DAPPU|nr:hypothetical protein DAPPUDRAFT_304114 [Daphnia pulex]|eukprot:EFX80415.1 hypothetical protein DAPPUDRAFT_304114 [Daphnia pulex]